MAPMVAESALIPAASDWRPCSRAPMVPCRTCSRTSMVPVSDVGAEPDDDRGPPTVSAATAETWASAHISRAFDDSSRAARLKGTRAALAGSMRILACRSGSPRAAKAASTPSRPTVPVISGAGVDLAVGDHVQRVAEFAGRVAECEAQFDLLVDRHRGVETCRAACTRPPRRSGTRRGGGDDLVDDAGHADAFEDHRALGPRVEGVHEPDRPPGRADSGCGAGGPSRRSRGSGCR